MDPLGSGAYFLVPQSGYGFAVMFFWLVVFHAIVDYSLQNDFIAQSKCPCSNNPGAPWYYSMSAHALTHGGAVALVLTSPFLGLLEAIAHFFIDWMKCEKYIDFHQDQALHLGCKLLWLGMLMIGLC